MRFLILVLGFIVVGCGQISRSKNDASASQPSGSSAGVSSVIDESALVVRGQAQLDVSLSNGDSGRSLVNSSNISVTVTASSNLTVNTASFVAPTITPANLSFGSLKISALSDNDLNVCGTDGATHCGTALIRMYTTGVAGAGLWNALGGYGAPLTTTLTTPLAVGLNQASAAILYTLSLPATKHVVSLSDFSPAPTFKMNFDFSNAGAGSYSTTIVIEYALAP